MAPAVLIAFFFEAGAGGEVAAAEEVHGAKDDDRRRAGDATEPWHGYLGRLPTEKPTKPQVFKDFADLKELRETLRTEQKQRQIASKRQNMPQNVTLEEKFAILSDKDRAVARIRQQNAAMLLLLIS